jgi:hypothetical protein
LIAFARSSGAFHEMTFVFCGPILLPLLG